MGSIEQALEAFQLMDMGQEDMDPETARRIIKDLQDLLEPKLEGADCPFQPVQLGLLRFLLIIVVGMAGFESALPLRYTPTYFAIIRRRI